MSDVDGACVAHAVQQQIDLDLTDMFKTEQENTMEEINDKPDELPEEVEMLSNPIFDDDIAQVVDPDYITGRRFLGKEGLASVSWTSELIGSASIWDDVAISDGRNMIILHSKEEVATLMSELEVFLRERKESKSTEGSN